MSTTPTASVILINRSLPSNCIGKLTGHSGVEYGYSIYEPAFGAHVCRLSLEDWEKCAKDVTLGAIRHWQQWEAHFETPDSPVGGADVIDRIRTADKDQLDAIVSGLSPLVQAVLARAKEVQPVQPQGVPAEPTPEPQSNFKESSSPNAPHEADDLDQVTTYRGLLSVAKKEGVTNADSIDSSAGLRAAIRAMRAAGSDATEGGNKSHEYKSGPDGKMFDIPEPPEPKAPALNGGLSS